MNHASRSFEIVKGDFLSSSVHPEDALPLDVFVNKFFELSSSSSCKVVMIDVYRCVGQGIHQDQKMVRAVMFLLMTKQKIHKGLFGLHPVPPFSTGIIQCLLPAAFYATVMSLAR
jgi:hypothetical protein